MLELKLTLIMLLFHIDNFLFISENVLTIVLIFFPIETWGSANVNMCPRDAVCGETFCNEVYTRSDVLVWTYDV